MISLAVFSLANPSKHFFSIALSLASTARIAVSRNLISAAVGRAGRRALGVLPQERERERRGQDEPPALVVGHRRRGREAAVAQERAAGERGARAVPAAALRRAAGERGGGDAPSGDAGGSGNAEPRRRF